MWGRLLLDVAKIQMLLSLFFSMQLILLYFSLFCSQNLGKAVRVQNCDAVLSFGFVKTHKAGSTTLISLFQRFGYRHNLKFALPKRGKSWMKWLISQCTDITVVGYGV